MSKVAIGSNASLTLPTGTGFKVDAYGYTNDRRLLNTSGFEDAEWDTFELGGRSAGLVATGHVKYDAAATNPDIELAQSAAQEYTLQFAAGCTLAADFVKYRATFNADKKSDQSRFTLLAQQTGDPTVTWDTSGT